VCRPIPHAACWSTFHDDRTTAALCIPHCSTRCTHPEQGRGTMPTHISTDMIGGTTGRVLPAATVVMHLRSRACCCAHASAMALPQRPLAPTHSRHVYPQGRPPSEPRCTYKLVRAVRALHSVGAVPLSSVLYRDLQVGRARTSGGGMHALHNTAPGDTQAAPAPPRLLCTCVEPSLCRRCRVWLCLLRAHACIVLCMSCRKPAPSDCREAGLQMPALLPDVGSLLST
jgi:hypothetical protein